MLISEVRATHGLFLNHISLMVLVVIPEGLLEFLCYILDDVLLRLCLRRHELLYDRFDSFHI